MGACASRPFPISLFSGKCIVPKKTKVVNRRNAEFEVYIGRPGPFGNPFAIGADGTRDEVIEKFRFWFYAPEQHFLRDRAIRELTGKVLGCYCAPQACHGDVLAEWCDLCAQLEASLE